MASGCIYHVGRRIGRHTNTCHFCQVLCIFQVGYEAAEFVDFVGPCNMCPYMKKITLEKVLWSLHTMSGAVEVEAEVSEKARVAVQRMIDLSRELGL